MAVSDRVGDGDNRGGGEMGVTNRGVIPGGNTKTPPIFLRPLDTQRTRGEMRSLRDLIRRNETIKEKAKQ